MSEHHDRNHSFGLKHNHISDPFRESEPVFKLEVEPAEKPQTKPEIQVEEKLEKELPPRRLKDVFRDAARQILASAAFLLIGFVLLNWGSLSQTVLHEWNKLTGAYDDSPLQELLVDENAIPDTEISREVQMPESDSKQIPDLSLQIAPNDNRIIIPKINKNVPIVGVSSESLIQRDWQALEQEMQSALRSGVVHYPGTSLPGQTGNVVITGHSSYFPWDPGRFKDVFALLHDVDPGDQIIIYYNQEKFVYEITEKEVILPDDISVLKQTPQDQLTLITCTPIGTNLKRLIVTATPVEQ